MIDTPRILYCHCAYAKIVPEEVKREVLKQLAASDTAFDAVADLCEMSAARDPALKELASQAPLCIVACYPRSVKWLFHAAASPLAAEKVTVLNMRTDTAEEILQKLNVIPLTAPPA